MAITAALGVASSLIPAISNTISTNRQIDMLKEQQEEYERLQKESEYRKNKLNSANIAATTDLNGNNVAMQMFAFGNNNIAPMHDNPEMVGTNAVPVSSTGMYTVGPTHEQGGIDVPGSEAEVEGGEVIDNGMVFSNRLEVQPGITFAEFAKNLENEKADNEKRMTETIDRYEVETLERYNEIIDSKLAKLFALQGIVKQQQTL